MYKRFFFLFSLFAFSFGCSSSTKMRVADEKGSVKEEGVSAVSRLKSNTSMTEEDNEPNTFEVRLKSNPSTGYRWVWVNRESAAADSVGFSFQTEKKSPPMCGAGGTEVWTFKPKVTGEPFLKFIYVRPWEKDNGADSIVVDIKNK